MQNLSLKVSKLKKANVDEEIFIFIHPYLSVIRQQTMYVVVGTPPLKRKISNYPPPRKI